MYRSLSAAALRHPGRTLALGVFAVALAAPGLGRLELRTDGHALVPRGRAEVRYDEAVRRRHGIRDPLVVVIESRDPRGIWNPATLAAVRRLTAATAALPGVGPAQVMSLATEPGFEPRPGSFARQKLLETLPETPEALARLRADVARLGLYDRLLVSADGRSAALYVGTPPAADRTAFYRRVLAVAEAERPAADAVQVLGAPVAETLLGEHILTDLGLPAAALGDTARSLSRTEPAAAHTPAAWVARLGRRVGMVPLALAGLALVFLLGFRRPLAALLPLAKMGLCLAVVLGAMGWLGVPIYLTTAVLPVVLLAVGVADEVHLLRRFRALAGERPGDSSPALLSTVLQEMGSPIVQTSLTTAVGFLSFAFSAIPPIRSFGLWTGVGVLVCLLWSLTLTPALLAVLPPRFWVPAGTGGNRPLSAPLFARLGRFASRHRRPLLAAAAALALLSADGLRRIVVQDSWLDGFAPSTPFARSMRHFEAQFAGAHRLLAVVEAVPLRQTGEIRGAAVEARRLLLPLPPGIEPARWRGAWVRVYQRPDPRRGEPPREWSSWVETAEAQGDRLVLGLPFGVGSPRFWISPTPTEPIGYELELLPFEVPATLARVGALERFLASRDGVGGTLGPAAVLSTAALIAGGTRGLPDRQGDLRNLWINTRGALGPERLAPIIDSRFSSAVITVFLQSPSYTRFDRLLGELAAYERRHLKPFGLRLRFAGDAAVSQALVRSVVTTQVESLALSLAGIFAVAALLGRSWRRGLLAILAPSFAVLLNFAVMGWTGIPLGVATSMFAGMTLGVGIDYSIHLLARYHDRRAAGQGEEAALADTLEAVGPAILLDAASVGLGFSTLLLSEVPANARLAALLILCVGHCLVATLLLVPALLTSQREG